MSETKGAAELALTARLGTFFNEFAAQYDMEEPLSVQYLAGDLAQFLTKPRGQRGAITSVLESHQDLAWNHDTGKAVCGGCDKVLGSMDIPIDVQHKKLRGHQADVLINSLAIVK